MSDFDYSVPQRITTKEVRDGYAAYMSGVGNKPGVYIYDLFDEWISDIEENAYRAGWYEAIAASVAMRDGEMTDERDARS